MADFASIWSLGEIFPDAETHVVEYDGTIVKGDLLKVVGVNADGQLRVQKQTTNTNARYVAIYDGGDGDIHEALFRGTTKVTFGGNVTPGGTGLPNANRIVATGTASSGASCCIIISDGAAAADTGLIFFNGGMA